MFNVQYARVSFALLFVCHAARLLRGQEKDYPLWRRLSSLLDGGEILRAQKIFLRIGDSAKKIPPAGVGREK